MKSLTAIFFFLLLVSLRTSFTQNIPFDHTPLMGQEDLSAEMVEGIHQFLINTIQEKKELRKSRWMKALRGNNSDMFLSENRAFLKERLGVTQQREKPKLELMVDSFLNPHEIITDRVTIDAVRWNVYDELYSEGIYLKPHSTVQARIIIIPDADMLPEDVLGIGEKEGIAYQLAEQGFEVLIPALINREDTNSGSTQLNRWTNQPHREWLYRQSYELGRHIIGEEIQKVLSAVDWFENQNDRNGEELSVGVMGYGEGGLLAFYAGAIDQRISSTLVSGYFNQREEVWKEPIYRNTFEIVAHMGDAEIATLYYPRNLVVEHSDFPEVNGPPEPRPGRSGAAPGSISTPSFSEVEKEWQRIEILRPETKENSFLFNAFQGNDGDPFSFRALRQFAMDLGVTIKDKNVSDKRISKPDSWMDPQHRQKRLVNNMQQVFQRAINQSEKIRDTFFWSKLEGLSKSDQLVAKETLREQLWNTLGRLPDPGVSLSPKARVVESNEKWTRYEVVLQVWPEVFAWGLLTIPNDIKQGEQRPVVVCQHGLEGLPEDVVIMDKSHKAYGPYKGYATQLAELGYITFAPHNPYRGEDKFRVLQRMANPIGYSLFSVIIGQHQQLLNWLKGLDFVNADKIAFYGLSYGGKTAMRIPAVLEDYVLSICSGDFNEWIRKNVSTELKYSYVFTKEYEMSEWNLGQTFNYAEMAAVIAPRPFMIEFGYKDGIGSVEWVNYEFGKVRKHYDLNGIPQRLDKQFFDGPHSIYGDKTFKFLEEHLK